MTVWISPRGKARHDVRVEVNMAHDNQMSIANAAVVGVRPTPRVFPVSCRQAMRRPCFAGLHSTLMLSSPMGLLGGTHRHGARNPGAETAGRPVL
jgi:hypothetical protein